MGEKENGAGVDASTPAAAAVKAAPATPAPYATSRVLTRAPRSRADRHAGEVVELICGASEMLEETVELQVLKCCSGGGVFQAFQGRRRCFASCARVTTSSWGPSPR